ncbi:MAG: phytanoyl-CoA dioxygenase family protein [Limisphaerales bacterium]
MQERYETDGYLVLDNLLPADHIAGLRSQMDDIAGGKTDFPNANVEFEPGSQAIRKINQCAENDPVFRAHAEHPAILDIVESLIGPAIKLFASQCFMKPPGGIEKRWHQDSAYFCIEPMNLVTCWTALDDVTVANGGMWVIPGSHQKGLVEHARWQLGDREDKQVELPDNISQQAIEMPAGSCSFHHSLLLHRSGPNRTDQPRRGLAVHYMAADCRWTDPSIPEPDYPLLRG